MAYCENCGKPVYALDTTCSNCGAPVKQTAQPVPTSTPSLAQMDTGEPPQGSPYAVLSSWGFVGSILLMSLPIAGFIIMIVWASGSTTNHNRRNLARAYLLIMGMVLALYLVIVIAALALGGSALLLNDIIN